MSVGILAWSSIFVEITPKVTSPWPALDWKTDKASFCRCTRHGECSHLNNHFLQRRANSFLLSPPQTKRWQHKVILLSNNDNNFSTNLLFTLFITGNKQLCGSSLVGHFCCKLISLLKSSLKVYRKIFELNSDLFIKSQRNVA